MKEPPGRDERAMGCLAEGGWTRSDFFVGLICAAMGGLLLRDFCFEGLGFAIAAGGGEKGFILRGCGLPGWMVGADLGGHD